MLSVGIFTFLGGEFKLDINTRYSALYIDRPKTRERELAKSDFKSTSRKSRTVGVLETLNVRRVTGVRSGRYLCPRLVQKVKHLLRVKLESKSDF